MKIVVLDSVPLSVGDLSFEALKTLGDVTFYERTRPEEIAERIGEADAVLTNKVKLRDEHFSAAPHLKYIGEMATGFDNIDVEAAKKRGITVCNVPSYSAAFTAQTTIALLLELTHHVGAHAAAVADGAWAASPDFAFWKHPLIELDGKTLVVIGTGNIGSRVSKIASAMGMNVVAAQVPGRDYGADSDHLPFDEALKQADVVSLHCPLKPATREMVNAEFLAKMKPSALLLNTGRGGLINEAELAQALKEGVIAGFGADVLSVEPPPADNPLLRAPNCLITPHLGWASPEARERCLNTVVENLKAFQNGAPQNVIL